MLSKAGLLFGTLEISGFICGPSVAAQAICQPSQIRLVNQVHELAQPYHGLVVNGGKAFAHWAGLKPDQYVVQVSERDPEKSVSEMRALLVSNPKCTVFNVEPANDESVQSLVDVANETGAWIVTHWAHGGQSHPADPANAHWIAHIAVPGVQPAKILSEKLFQAMGGSGGIVALQGNLANDPAVQRFKGLKEALKEHPQVTLLDDQTATWDRAKAFPIVQTWLSKYGDKIKGIWAANDAMAMGAVEALRAAGLAGKIPVIGMDGTPEAVAAIKSGDLVATAAADGYYQGSIGLAMGYCVLTGQVPPPNEWKPEDREFYLRVVVIDKDNAPAFANGPNPESYAKETWPCDKLFARNTGPAH